MKQIDYEYKGRFSSASTYIWIKAAADVGAGRWDYRYDVSTCSAVILGRLEKAMFSDSDSKFA